MGRCGRCCRRSSTAPLTAARRDPAAPALRAGLAVLTRMDSVVFLVAGARLLVAPSGASAGARRTASRCGPSPCRLALRRGRGAMDGLEARLLRVAAAQHLPRQVGLGAPRADPLGHRLHPRLLHLLRRLPVDRPVPPLPARAASRCRASRPCSWWCRCGSCTSAGSAADFMEYRFMVVVTPLLAMLAAWLIDRFVNPRTEALLVGGAAAVLARPPGRQRAVPDPRCCRSRNISHWPNESKTTWLALGNKLHDTSPAAPTRRPAGHRRGATGGDLRTSPTSRASTCWA